eukprot:COSAG01_NODE_34386_length_548_cov_1.641425_2_plen_75_part_01
MPHTLPEPAGTTWDKQQNSYLFTAHFHLYLQRPVPTPAAPWATGFTPEQQRRDAPASNRQQRQWEADVRSKNTSI